MALERLLHGVPVMGALLPQAWVRRAARRAVAAGTAAAYLTVLVGPTVAQTIEERAAEGEAYGRSLIVDPNDLVRMGPDGGSVQLFPDSGAPLVIDLGELFPASPSGPVIADPSAFYGDDAGLRAAAGARAGALATTPTLQGEAWRTVIDSRRRAGVDLRSDPIATETAAMLGSLASLAAEFTSCTPTTGFAPRDIVNRVTTERTCLRASRPSTVETVSHELAIAVDTFDVSVGVPPEARRIEIDFLTGRARLDYVTTETRTECRDGGGEFSSGSCTTVTVEVPRQVSAAVPALIGEQYCGADADRVLSVFHEHAAFGAVTATIATTVAPSCANGLTYVATIGGDGCYTVTRGGGRDDDPVTETICPAGQADLKFAVTRLTRDAWGPKETVDGLLALQAAGCTPAYDTLAGGRRGGARCVDLGAGEICPGDALHALTDPPPFDVAEAQVDRLATQVRADTSACTPFVPVAESCAPLESDPACTYRTTWPVTDPAITEVTLHEDVYDCETSRTVRSAVATGALVCPPAVRGIGDDLVTPVYETNTSFHEVAGQLAAAQFMSMDTVCGDPADSSVDPLQCRVFDGERGTCKVAAFGVVDCCSSPGGVSLIQYLQLAFAVGKLDGAIGHLDKGNAVRGAWEFVAGPFDAAYDVVLKNFATGVNSIAGTDLISVSDLVSQGVVGSIEKALVNKTAEWTAQIFGDAAANTLFVNAAAPRTVAAASGGVLNGPVALGPALNVVASALNFVMVAYTIYQVAVLIATIVWACTQQELETAVKRDLRACHYNGQYCASSVLGFCLERRRSYCCFAGPLPRIMQEQIRLQRGVGWGSARNPQCDGFTVADLQTVDFASLDLSEWVDILIDTGVMPDASDMTLEALTGSGHTFADALPPGMTRLDVLDRTMSRAGGIANGAVLRDAERSIIGEIGP